MPQFRPRATKVARTLRASATEAERRLWRHLCRRQLAGRKFCRQMPIGPFVCDFLCREHRLVIEVDGGQHCDSERDRVRTAFLESEGYRVIRFWNHDVLDHLDGVLSAIGEAIADPPPAPSRSREGNPGSARQ